MTGTHSRCAHSGEEKKTLVSPGNRTIFSSPWPGLCTDCGNHLLCHSSEVSRWPFLSEATVQSPASACTICGEQSGTWIHFCPNTFLVPCQYHCTNCPFSFIRSSITDARLVSSYPLTVSLNNSHSRGTLKQCFRIGGTRNVVYWRATLFRN